jgi:hypothetical protein
MRGIQIGALQFSVVNGLRQLGPDGVALTFLKPVNDEETAAPEDIV